MLPNPCHFKPSHYIVQTNCKTIGNGLIQHEIELAITEQCMAAYYSTCLTLQSINYILFNEPLAKLIHLAYIWLKNSYLVIATFQGSVQHHCPLVEGSVCTYISFAHTYHL